MAFRMPDEAELAAFTLRVHDLEAGVGFYTDVLGLRITGRDDVRVALAPEEARFSLELVHAPDAPLRPYPCPGLYHFALVVPDRPALGAIFRHLIDVGWEFEGMSDHIVSEALYLRDPEMNGIELYRDRPRDEWETTPDGGIRLVSDPIDAEGVLRSATGPAKLDPGTRLGHVHFHGRSVDDGNAFYMNVLGLHQTATIPRASFLAAGDYHHHVGYNTWAPLIDVPANATGMTDYTWRLPAPAVDALAEHVRETGTEHGRIDGAIVLVDPVGINVRVTS